MRRRCGRRGLSLIHILLMGVWTALSIQGSALARNSSGDRRRIYSALICLLYTSAVGEASLPMGILGGVSGQSRVVHLAAGDYVVLVSDGLLAVSYTHLDVYKRQVPGRVRDSAPCCLRAG